MASKRRSIDRSVRIIKTENGGTYELKQGEYDILSNPTGWLNDTIIELYAHILIEKNLKANPNLTCIVLSCACFRYSTGRLPVKPGWKLNNQRLTIGFIGEQSHWSVMIIDSEMKYIHWFDSLQGIHDIRMVRKMIRAIIECDPDANVKEYSMCQYNTEQQKDTFSCGIYALINLKFFLGVIPTCADKDEVATWMDHVHFGPNVNYRILIRDTFRTYKNAFTKPISPVSTTSSSSSSVSPSSIPSKRSRHSHTRDGDDDDVVVDTDYGAEIDESSTIAIVGSSTSYQEKIPKLIFNPVILDPFANFPRQE
jgi:hypothetical protein